MIKLDHEDMDYLYKKYSQGLIQKLKLAQETLNILEKSGNLKSKFPSLYHNYPARGP